MSFSPTPVVWDNTTKTWVPDKANTTHIEGEIMDYMQTYKENGKKARLSNLVRSNLENFLKHIQTHPMVQAEIELYNCVLKRHENIL